jgi:hypothetical protein
MAVIPFDQTETYKGKFRFVVADGHFDVPILSIRKGDLLDELGRLGRSSVPPTWKLYLSR